mmetsp:Transcript_16190/g.35229  ORF Transcript_16190/g.35229 Transcript_16190/m.35229 type:complete len:362 (+) Transcript_16190:704-1789(+)
MEGRVGDDEALLGVLDGSNEAEVLPVELLDPRVARPGRGPEGDPLAVVLDGAGKPFVGVAPAQEGPCVVGPEPAPHDALERGVLPLEIGHVLLEGLEEELLAEASAPREDAIALATTVDLGLGLVLPPAHTGDGVVSGGGRDRGGAHGSVGAVDGGDRRGEGVASDLGLGRDRGRGDAGPLVGLQRLRHRRRRALLRYRRRRPHGHRSGGGGLGLLRRRVAHRHHCRRDGLGKRPRRQLGLGSRLGCLLVLGQGRLRLRGGRGLSEVRLLGGGDRPGVRRLLLLRRGDHLLHLGQLPRQVPPGGEGSGDALRRLRLLKLGRRRDIREREGIDKRRLVRDRIRRYDGCGILRRQDHRRRLGL